MIHSAIKLKLFAKNRMEVLCSHFKSTYNEFNDLTALLIVNAAGKIVGTIHTITYIYDKQNNWIKATIIGKDGICIRERIIEYF